MKKTISLFLALVLALTLLPTAAFADAGDYTVSITQTVNGKKVYSLQGLDDGTEVTASVTLTRTDVTGDSYGCRGMELDLAVHGMDYIDGSAQTFTYTTGGEEKRASVSGFYVDPLTGVGLTRYFFLYGERDTAAAQTTVPRSVTVSARYRVTDASNAWTRTVKPIIYIGGERAESFDFSEYSVTFQPNGGYLDNDASGIYSIGEQLTLPTPTRPGYRFLGWKHDGQTLTGEWTVDGDAAFTAEWEAVSNMLRGTVYGADNKPVRNASVRLTQDGSEIASFTTDDGGLFAVNLDDGTYNITVTDPVTKNTVTRLITVDGTMRDISVTLTAGVSSVLDDTDAGSFHPMIGELDKAAKNEKPADSVSAEYRLIFTDDSRENTLSAGERAKYDAGKAAIGALSEAAGQTLSCFNLALRQTVVGGANAGTTMLDSVDTLLRLTLSLDMSDKDQLRVFKATDTGAERLQATPNAKGEYISINTAKGTIDIYTKSLTAYAIGYKAKSSGGSGSGSGSSSGGSSGSSGSGTLRPVASPTVTGVADWLVTDRHVAYLDGYRDGRVLPNANITRAEVAMVLYRLLLDDNAPTKGSFPDVKPTSWYAEAVGVLSGLGILTGYKDGYFRPSQPITRAEFATVVTRFAKGTSGTATFTDVPAKYWAAGSIGIAASYGWVNGYKDGTFQPRGNVTRAEVAVMMNHMLGRVPDQEYILANTAELRQFSDLREHSRWYYFDMMEAVNEHSFTVSNSAETWK